MDPLQSLRQSFKAICDKLGADWPIHTSARHDGSPHIEVSEGKYSYVVTERGAEYERRTSESQDELLYWLTSDLVFSLAGHYEMNHRVNGQDSRRIMFARELELFGRIDSSWRLRKETEISDMISRRPYRD